jgi:hypothetical protein
MYTPVEKSAVANTTLQKNITKNKFIRRYNHGKERTAL